MDYAIPIRQLARVFVDAQSVVLTPEVMQNLARDAQVTERLSTDLLHMPLVDPTALAGTPPRYALVSANHGWQLALMCQSFDLQRVPVDVAGSNIGNIRDFAAMSVPVLVDCARIFGRAPHRLALAQSGMLGEMSVEQMDDVARRLLRFPSNVGSQNPFEWDWRCARNTTLTFGKKTEKINLVQTIKRCSGVMQNMATNERVPYDRVQVELDINTVPADTRGRFDEASTHDFFLAALEEYERAWTEVTDLISGVTA